MQLGLSFTLLLASLLVAFSTVDAAPLKRQNSGMVTLPLKRVHGPRDGIHPQILLQQHINRSHRRLARMTGRAGPSSDELASSIAKRVTAADEDIRRRSVLDKRYNRNGLGSVSKGISAVINNAKAKLTGAKTAAVAAAAKAKGKKGGKKAAAAAAAAAAGVGAGTAVAANAAGAASSNSTSAGVSPIDIQAAQQGGLTAANTPATANSIGLDIEANDVGYIATVQIGTPPRDFSLLMDSGSADLWVGAEGCTSTTGGGCGNHVFLGAKSSSSFKDTKAPFQVTYGTGAVAGDIITDDITVAGLALAAHTFGVALQETNDFASNSVPFDGLMGLAQSSLSEQQTLTPIESLAKAGLVTEAITSYKISRLADQKNDGEITFGGLDASKFDSATLVNLANVNKQGFWEASMDAVTADGQDLGLTGRTAILDTGTTLIVAPPADALAVHKAIPGAASDGQGGFTIPCTTTTSIAFSFGGTSFAIDPRDLAFSPVNANDPTGDCVSGISSGQIGGAQEWLVGDVFLKNAYFSTDVGKNTLALAKLV